MNNIDIDFKETRSKRNITLFSLGTLAVFSGFSEALLYSNELLLKYSAIITSLIAIAIIYFWIIYDAKLHKYRIPKYIKYTVILFSIIGIPIYFWQTRNLKNFVLNIGGLWLFAFYRLLYLISAYITGSILN